MICNGILLRVTRAPVTSPDASPHRSASRVSILVAAPPRLSCPTLLRPVLSRIGDSELGLTRPALGADYSLTSLTSVKHREDHPFRVMHREDPVTSVLDCGRVRSSHWVCASFFPVCTRSARHENKPTDESSITHIAFSTWLLAHGCSRMIPVGGSGNRSHAAHTTLFVRLIAHHDANITCVHRRQTRTCTTLRCPPDMPHHRPHDRPPPQPS